MENSSYAGDRKGTAPTIDELVEQCLRSIVGAIPCGRPLVAAQVTCITSKTPYAIIQR